MEPLTIVEPLDKGKDLPTRFIPGVTEVMVDKLILERAEEAFRHRIVITVPSPTHARRGAVFEELLLIGATTVLGPLVGVINQPRTELALVDRHRERGKRQLLIRPVPHGPADDSP